MANNEHINLVEKTRRYISTTHRLKRQIESYARNRGDSVPLQEFINLNDYNVAFRTLENLQHGPISELPLERLHLFRIKVEQVRNYIETILEDIEAENSKFDPREYAFNLNQLVQETKDQLSNDVTSTLQLKLSEAHQELNETRLHNQATEIVDESTDEAEKFFLSNAEKYEGACKHWLYATFASGVFTFFMTLAFVLMSFENYPDLSNSNQYQFIRVSATSLLFITFLLGVTLWFSRMYKANLHLQTINNHRATSLSVVNTLRAGSLTDGAKDTIVTEAARAIFSDPQTGLLIDKSSNNSTSFNIGDLIKSDVK